MYKRQRKKERKKKRRRRKERHATFLLYGGGGFSSSYCETCRRTAMPSERETREREIASFLSSVVLFPSEASAPSRVTMRQLYTREIKEKGDGGWLGGRARDLYFSTSNSSFVYWSCAPITSSSSSSSYSVSSRSNSSTPFILLLRLNILFHIAVCRRISSAFHQLGAVPCRGFKRKLSCWTERERERGLISGIRSLKCQSFDARYPPIFLSSPSCSITFRTLAMPDIFTTWRKRILFFFFISSSALERLSSFYERGNI